MFVPSIIGIRAPHAIVNADANFTILHRCLRRASVISFVEIVIDCLCDPLVWNRLGVGMLSATKIFSLQRL